MGRRRPSPIEVVNSLRSAVREWREAFYIGASDTSRYLLNHWFNRAHRQTTAAGEDFEFRYYLNGSFTVRAKSPPFNVIVPPVLTPSAISVTQGGSLSAVFVAAPGLWSRVWKALADVADELQYWFEEGAADGYPARAPMARWTEGFDAWPVPGAVATTWSLGADGALTAGDGTGAVEAAKIRICHVISSRRLTRHRRAVRAAFPADRSERRFLYG